MCRSRHVLHRMISDNYVLCKQYNSYAWVNMLCSAIITRTWQSCFSEFVEFVTKLNIPWWRHQMETFPRYWPFVRGIPRAAVNSPHKGQWRGALIFSVICVWINGWVNNGEAGDLRRYRAHYYVSVMPLKFVLTSICRHCERTTMPTRLWLCCLTNHGTYICIASWRLDYWEMSIVKSPLVKQDFQAWYLIRWQQSRQPIGNHVLVH